MRKNMNIEYACIGEVLKHSFSKEIHNALADYDYGIVEIPREELAAFAQKKQFKGINVTIPYKKDVLGFLDEISDDAKSIGAVNTVVIKNGKRYGYNTDVFGLLYTLERKDINLSGKTVMILGTGGASNAVKHVAEKLGASKIAKNKIAKNLVTIFFIVISPLYLNVFLYFNIAYSCLKV